MVKHTPGKNAKPSSGKLSGKTIAFVGKFGHRDMLLPQFTDYAVAEGGAIVDAEKIPPDYLVTGEGRGGNPPPLIAKLQKKHPTIQVIDEAKFCQLLLPTCEELYAELQAGTGEDIYDRWNYLDQLFTRSGTGPDLSGVDLRKTNLFGVKLMGVKLDGADLREVTAHYAYFGSWKGVCCDGADLSHLNLNASIEGCSFRKATLTKAWLDGYGPGPKKHQRCDFSHAGLQQCFADQCEFVECKFCNADMRDAEIPQANFSGSDLSGADLSQAHASRGKFENANLSGAVLVRADLREASLKNADLRNADLREAVLSGADLTGAQIDGADFTGAVLTGAKTAGLDSSRAKNLHLARPREPGPNIVELAKIAAAATKLFVTSAEIELQSGLYATLSITGNGTSLRAVSRYQHDGQYINDWIEAPTFEQGMFNLADRWPNVTLRLDTVKAKGSRTLRGKKLLELATVAWAEAFGLDADKSDKQKQDQQAGVEKLREAMLAELREGEAGITKWNARPRREHEHIGALRGLDLTRGKLAHVQLLNRDLRDSRFEEADLQDADMHTCRLQGANFDRANLSAAKLSCIDAEKASFESAILVACNLYAANLKHARFHGADLTSASFVDACLQGADFTDARLTDAIFTRAQYDETTKFPEGFNPSEEMGT